jgi:hypothetical protein
VRQQVRAKEKADMRSKQVDYSDERGKKRKKRKVKEQRRRELVVATFEHAKDQKKDKRDL